MIEHYFVAAWIPPQEDTNTISSRATANTAIISMTGKPLAIGPNEQTILRQSASYPRSAVSFT